MNCSLFLFHPLPLRTDYCGGFSKFCLYPVKKVHQLLGEGISAKIAFFVVAIFTSPIFCLGVLLAQCSSTRKIQMIEPNDVDRAIALLIKAKKQGTGERTLQAFHTGIRQYCKQNVVIESNTVEQEVFTAEDAGIKEEIDNDTLFEEIAIMSYSAGQWVFRVDHTPGKKVHDKDALIKRGLERILNKKIEIIVAGDEKNTEPARYVFFDRQQDKPLRIEAGVATEADEPAALRYILQDAFNAASNANQISNAKGCSYQGIEAIRRRCANYELDKEYKKRFKGAERAFVKEVLYTGYTEDDFKKRVSLSNSLGDRTSTINTFLAENPSLFQELQELQGKKSAS